MSVEQLSADDFASFFEAVHDHPPYPWQVRLTKQVLTEERWPEVIDLPTGTGKTAVLDTAVFALAAKPKVFPRRVVFVIDRRIVVDQVYERAQRISHLIRIADGGVLDRVRSALDEVAADVDQPIGVSALRGGIPLDNEWATRPDQPWVMVSTVDQFGSKLLFRGYGVSSVMRPVHAGLAGNDCLVILDEVHLSRPFLATLRDIKLEASSNSFDATLLPKRGGVVEMSATPPGDERRRFVLDPATDLDGPDATRKRLRRIARAPKRACLVPLPGSAPHAALPKEILRIVRKKLQEHERSVGVVVNRVRTAREVKSALSEAGFTAHLITGRMRPLDRERRLREISELVDPDGRNPEADRTVVVATQSIEVGADFSFDALITEACPLDSLRQRVGRLDRRGTLARDTGRPARCWILGLKSDVEGKRPDPIYGQSVRVTWRELCERAVESEIDVGPASERLEDFPVEARAPAAKAPLLLPTHIEAWAQTSPEPLVQPDISEFLHGFVESPPEPEVSIVWRRDRSSEALRLVPPRPAEHLSVPMSAARAWLRGADETPTADVGTPAPQSRPTRAGDETASTASKLVCRYCGGDEIFEEVGINEVRPGDVLLVDPAQGGLTAGTWDPQPAKVARTESGADDHHGTADAAVDDLGDEAQWAYGRRRTLRLSDGLRLQLQRRLGGDVAETPGPISEAAAEGAQPTALSRRQQVQAWARNVLQVADSQPADSGSLPAWLAGGHPRPLDDAEVANGRRSGALQEQLGMLRWLAEADEREFSVELVTPRSSGVATPSGQVRLEDYFVVVERSVDVATLGTGGNDASLTGTGVLLEDHLSGVGNRAAAFGHRLGLSDALIADLRRAGEMHDLGKVDSRFQAQMVGHDRVRLAMQDKPLAKSLPSARPRPHLWPPVRHEVASVAMAQSAQEFMARCHDPDLVLHLVATHHGQGRPLPRIVSDDCPQDLAYEIDGTRLFAHTNFSETPMAIEMADRFWRLSAKYGHHGLAWLEAILRLADHRQSEQEAHDLAGSAPEVS
ncbi:type I-G CRISPR-associated helicase/endonuclease Cas3g [Candidatus Poriferisodalis sp.]|uniref:type I-G CRISPR-associated helicase/endonuclease Cas3g n=1 Tax=Candidatus Poriferisodalis sp. TaxID=3101277 RepID=UPI003B527510